ncbi:hypothetical protein KCU78_g8152, partial [Aureobasidium melanogenum]
MATKKNLSLKEKYPEIYAQTNIDRTGRERVVPMEVLSLGLGRTGTMSMKAAYEILGYPTYHYVSMMENPPDLDLWLSALRRKYSPHPDEKPFTVAKWNALLGHVSAVTDSPINAFGPELIIAYPHAKVVLVEREVESWYKSFEKNVISSFAAPMTRILIQLLSNESTVKVEQGEGSGGGSDGGVPPNTPANTAGTDGSVGVVSPTLTADGQVDQYAP